MVSDILFVISKCQQVESLQAEIADLQSEFEFDRIDYLDTIRKQERQLALLQAIIDKIHPCLRRDCNYASLDRVKAQCQWDEENGHWILPRMSIEKTKLPPAGTKIYLTSEASNKHYTLIIV